MRHRAGFAAAAAVLTSDGHDGAAYELGGTPFTASTDLQRLIGRPSRPLTDVGAAAVKTA